MLGLKKLDKYMKINITGRNIDEYTSTSGSIPVSSFGRDGEIPFALVQYVVPEYTQSWQRIYVSKTCTIDTLS
ncbi:MAG: hypothetical protein J0L79_04770 [Rickettsiales bacterium]|nr:hypothetical protein [Rickettsiales bacterium]MCA0254737.1 hypothetical protein [Pseudomonadota bacterium]